MEALPEARAAEKLDVEGRVILPGFVDSHTHLVHAASRAEEYELKIAGASYEEIARKGGGILNSVKKLRAATSEALKARALAALREFAASWDHDDRGEERLRAGCHQRAEDFGAAPGVAARTASGDCFDLFGRACGSGGVSGYARRATAVRGAADRTG